MGHPRAGLVDFLAAYVVFEDAWYILPAGKVAGRETVCLFSKSKYASGGIWRGASFEHGGADGGGCEILHPLSGTG